MPLRSPSCLKSKPHVSALMSTQGLQPGILHTAAKALFRSSTYCFHLVFFDAHPGGQKLRKFQGLPIVQCPGPRLRGQAPMAHLHRVLIAAKTNQSPQFRADSRQAGFGSLDAQIGPASNAEARPGLIAAAEPKLALSPATSNFGELG